MRRHSDWNRHERRIARRRQVEYDRRTTLWMTIIAVVTFVLIFASAGILH